MLVVARLVELVRTLAVKCRGERDPKSAVLDCPFLGARNEGGPDTVSARLLLDDDRGEPRGGLIGMQGVKEMNGHHSHDVSILAFGDENRRARARVNVFEAIRYLSGICGIPQLVEQAAKCSGVFRRCLSDSERVHPAPSILQQSV
jgi:hypothetical protein